MFNKNITLIKLTFFGKMNSYFCIIKAAILEQINRKVDSNLETSGGQSFKLHDMKCRD